MSKKIKKLEKIIYWTDSLITGPPTRPPELLTKLQLVTGPEISIAPPELLTKLQLVTKPEIPITLPELLTKLYNLGVLFKITTGCTLTLGVDLDKKYSN